MNIDKWGGAPEKWASVCEELKKVEGKKVAGKWKTNCKLDNFTCRWLKDLL